MVEINGIHRKTLTYFKVCPTSADLESYKSGRGLQLQPTVLQPHCIMTTVIFPARGGGVLKIILFEKKENYQTKTIGACIKEILIV